jgi:NAD(P)-dependent dehydrogenase (short-subunit alcohol dehydrogenase family)
MPFHLTDPDDWWYSMEINVKSPVELTRMVLPSMRRRNAGTLIYTSSRAANAKLAVDHGVQLLENSHYTLRRVAPSRARDGPKSGGWLRPQWHLDVFHSSR